MKRREGGVIVSSRLGAAGRVFARVCVRLLTRCVFFAHPFAAGGTMPVCWQGTRKNATQLRFEYTTFQKLPLTKSDPA